MNNVSCNLTISNDLPYEVRSARFIEFFEAYLVDSFTHLDEEIRKYAMEAALAGGKKNPTLIGLPFCRSWVGISGIHH